MTKGRGGGVTPEPVKNLINARVAEFGQSAVARDTGLTRQTVQRYMKGIGEPSQATLQKLADYFDVPLAFLRGDAFRTKFESEFADEIINALRKKLSVETAQEIKTFIEKSKITVRDTAEGLEIIFRPQAAKKPK